MKTTILLTLALVGFNLTAFSQEKSRKELKGDKQYFVYSFDRAIESYSHTKHLTVDGQRKLAMSYANLHRNTEAEGAYSRLVNTAGGDTPEDFYNYAMILKTNGNHNESAVWMNKFVALKPEDLRARDYTANNARLSEMSADAGKYKIGQINVNSNDNDFAPCYYKNSLVFASSRARPKMVVKNSNWSGKPYANLFTSEIDGEQLKKPENFSKRLNSKLNDGPASFSRNGSFMAFTQNDDDVARKNRIVNLHIMFSTQTSDKWSTPEAFSLNSDSYSVGHPCLSEDGNTMYFVSDMPGGYGGADIYRITRPENGNWGTAVNLGNTINTEGDEMFPFLEETNEVLFFTSDGRFGLGGYDIFMCAVNGNEYGKVVNAGAPLNTTSDDFAMIVDSTLTKGYFTSNRVGGNGGDDIYKVDLLTGLDIGKRLKGIAKDNSGTFIPYTFITLLDAQGEVIDTLTTKEDGAYVFLVDKDKKLNLTGRKEGYKDGAATVSTYGKELVVKADVTLLKKEEYIEQAIVPTADLAVILEMKPIFFDLDKYAIRKDAEPELNSIVKTMNEHPTMVVELRSYADCRETAEYNMTLSEKRAKASTDYIRKRITNPNRITGKGYGESNLVNGCACSGSVVSDCSEEEHQKNRRTEFIVITK